MEGVSFHSFCHAAHLLSPSPHAAARLGKTLHLAAPCNQSALFRRAPQRRSRAARTGRVGLVHELRRLKQGLLECVDVTLWTLRGERGLRWHGGGGTVAAAATLAAATSVFEQRRATLTSSTICTMSRSGAPATTRRGSAQGNRQELACYSHGRHRLSPLGWRHGLEAAPQAQESRMSSKQRGRVGDSAFT